MRLFSLFVAIFYSFGLFGQLPETNLWCMQLKKVKDSLYIGKTENIAQNKGYHNQPAFSLDSKYLYFVSADSAEQTDIYQYDLRSGKKRPITQTPLSEYSPQEIQKGILYSVVVEKDSSQRIHQIIANNGVHLNILGPDSVGYYCFLNADTMIYYKLTEPHSLRAYFLSSKQEVWLGNNPGRGFKKINSTTLLYCLKDSIRANVYQYNFRVHKARFVCSFPQGGEDIFWHSKLGLLRSEGTQILQYQEKLSDWKLLFDIKMFGLHRITRFVIDEQLKHLIVVDNL